MEEYKVKINDFGTISWYQHGKRHRLNGPAVEFSNGTKWWFQNSKLHRLDGPAIIDERGNKAWYQNGKLHRTDGPAIEWSNGTKNWYLNGTRVTEQDVMNNDCSGKIVEIDGIKYKLVSS